MEKVTTAASDMTTRYFYDDWNLIEERAVSGAGSSAAETLRARYGYGHTDDELVWIDRDNASPDGMDSRYFLSQDAIGSVVAATSDPTLTGGTLGIAERYTYSGYGQRSVWTGSWSQTDRSYAGSQSSSLIGMPFGFTGQRIDPESGLAYYKHRYFDPALGTFLSRDPMGYSTGPSLYQYALGRPSDLADPLGLMPQTPGPMIDNIQITPAEMIKLQDEAAKGSLAAMMEIMMRSGCNDRWLCSDGGVDPWAWPPPKFDLNPEIPTSGSVDPDSIPIDEVITVTADKPGAKSLDHGPDEGSWLYDVRHGTAEHFTGKQIDQATGVRYYFDPHEQDFAKDCLIDFFNISTAAADGVGLAKGGFAAARAMFSTARETGELSGTVVPFAKKVLGIGKTAARDAAETGGGQNFVYRGVHAGHPAMDAALEGRVVPGNVSGTITAEAHNAGGWAAESPFTSWTDRYDVAVSHATKSGPGGVILRFPVGAPPAGASWSWAWSPDVYAEGEILLRGTRDGASVLLP